MSSNLMLEVAVIGATGALGSELVAVLGERDFPVGRLRPIASESSLGESVELRGEEIPVEVELTSLDGIDLIFLCAPPEVSLDYAGKALRARVPAIDLSGALADQPDVSLLVGEWSESAAESVRPLVAGPGGATLALALVLAPLERAAGLRRVVVTTFEAASVAGRQGVEELSEESIALFNQQPVSDDSAAFDCRPAVESPDDDGATLHETRVVAGLQRLLGRELDVAVTSVRVPTFGGDGLSVWIETERPLDPQELQAALEKAPGVTVWPEPAGPSTRASVERDVVLVGRLRAAGGGLGFWVSVDGLHLAARNAVLLAEARPFARLVS